MYNFSPKNTPQAAGGLPCVIAWKDDSHDVQSGEGRNPMMAGVSFFFRCCFFVWKRACGLTKAWVELTETPLGNTMCGTVFWKRTFFEMQLYIILGSKIFRSSDHQQNHHPSRFFFFFFFVFLNRFQLPHEDASWCFAGAASGTIYVWLASTGSLLRYWPAHFREVFCLETRSQPAEMDFPCQLQGVSKLDNMWLLANVRRLYINMYINLHRIYYISYTHVYSMVTGEANMVQQLPFLIWIGHQQCTHWVCSCSFSTSQLGAFTTWDEAAHNMRGLGCDMRYGKYLKNMAGIFRDISAKILVKWVVLGWNPSLSTHTQMYSYIW